MKFTKQSVIFAILVVTLIILSVAIVMQRNIVQGPIPMVQVSVVPTPDLDNIAPTPTVSPPMPVSVSVSISASDIATWKSYENEKYGFSFKYPNDWTIEETTMSEVEGSYFSLRRNFQEVFGIGVFRGSIEKDILNKIQPRPSTIDLDIDGRKAIGIAQGGFELPYQIFFERDGLVFYEAEAPSTQQGDGAYIKAILSTFN